MSEPSGVQYGGFWIRLVALLADSAIVFLVSALVLMGAAMALGPEGLAPIGLGVTLLGLLYWPVMHASRRQATFGKAIVGLRVTRFDGRRISILRSVWREIAKIFSGAVLMLGYIMAAFTPRKQGLHDLMSATYVVREGPAHVVGALGIAVLGFVLPVVAGPMIVGAAVLSSMTSMAQGFISQPEPMKQVVRAPIPAKPAPKPAAPPAVVAKAPPATAPTPQPRAQEVAKPVADVKVVTPPPLPEPLPATAAAAPAPKVVASGPKPKVVTATPKPRQTALKPRFDSGLKHNDLMSAVLDGDVQSVNDLLRLGKWVDKPDSRGATPLMVAAGRGDLRTAEVLLRGGADARLAVPVAEQRRNGEMVSLLKRYAR